LSEAEDLLGTGGGVDGEEIERLLLERGRTGVHNELVSRIERGSDGVSRERGKVGD
jgi:hypothetical protein